MGRVLEASGPDLTAFNLGIRRDTSDDVLSRWRQETAARFLPGADNRLVVSFGSNDMVEQGDGTLRVEPARSLANLAALLDSCGSRGICVLVVGPPPVADAGESHLLRTAELSDRMAALCDDRSVAFVPTTRALAADPVWTSEALSGDGAHPRRAATAAWPSWCCPGLGGLARADPGARSGVQHAPVAAGLRQGEDGLRAAARGRVGGMGAQQVAHVVEFVDLGGGLGDRVGGEGGTLGVDAALADGVVDAAGAAAGAVASSRPQRPRRASRTWRRARSRRLR
ncbi:GDSL-type esterase/lipase family protein [Streptacidiphilus monticola]